MRNFKAIDWILILGLVGALLVGGVVLATRLGGDDPLDVVPEPLRSKIESDINYLDNALDHDSPIKVVEVLRGNNAWCVEIKQGSTSLVFPYPDDGSDAGWGETYGCQ